MVLAEDPPFIGDWHRQKKLGAGGFGVVTLWKNQKTLQSVAIKRCHLTVSNQNDPAFVQQKERWNREVNYMTNAIKNENIVQGMKMEPNSFLIELNRQNPSSMPILVMEYCEGGDLRRILNANQNTSGFVESEVRSILKCLGNAIAYLHGLKITHRDIKPENIVLKTMPNGQKIYKLTDLGYAKPLDRQSLVASLVGTLEYIAPELFITDKYSNSVDYWSFGIIAYEIITGCRPFVPHMSFAQWMITVKKKSSSDICIIEDLNGDIKYLTELPIEHQISKSLAQNLEEWLKLALEWNPKQRGHIFEGTTRPSSVPKSDCLPPIQVLRIFTQLDAILEKRILTVFCLHSFKSLSIEINNSTTMDVLLQQLATASDIAVDKIRLIIPLENGNLDKVIETTKPIQLYWTTNADQPMVYMTKIGESMRKDTKAQIPDLIKELLVDHKCKLKSHNLKHFAYNAYYFVRLEQKKYIISLEGMRIYVLRLTHEVELYETEVNRMLRLVYGVEGAMTLLDEELKQFEERLKNQSTEYIDQSILPLQTQCLDECTKLSANILTMVGACQQIVKRYRSVFRRSREIAKHRLTEKIQQDYYGVYNMEKSFEIVRERLLAKVAGEKDQQDMVKYAYHCLKRRDQLLNDKELLDWHSVTSAVAIEMEEISKAIDKAIMQAEKYQREVQKANAEHQDRLWRLIKAPRPSEYLPDIDRILNRTSIYEDPYRSNAQQSGPSGINFKIGHVVSNDVGPSNGSVMRCFGEGDDTVSLIHDNEQLLMTLSGLVTDLNKEFQIKK